MVNDLSGKLIADKYRVDELIREDDTGDLYSARHEVLDRQVTLKILPAAVAVDQRWVKRFVGEARAASALTHPHVLNLTDFGTDAKGVTYAVFEPTEGTTLRDAIADGPQADEVRALEIVRQIAGAVAAAHAKNIPHGRLSPSSIFTDGDSVKVYGFGTDALESARGADPRYLAPEQCNPFPSSDARSDVYTLGVIFYELLSGTVPYTGFTPADIAQKQNGEPPAPLSAFRDDLHPDTEPILLSAMAVDPERRYPTMAAFAEDLDMLAARVGGEPAVAAAATGAATPASRRSWQTALFVFAGVAIFAVALIYATSVRKTDPTQTLAAVDGSLPVQPIGPATGAQEESLAKLPALTEAEIMAAAAAAQNMDQLPGGDGYNAWANGGVPPAGAPLTGAPLAGSQPGFPSNGGMMPPPINYIPPGGTVTTVDGQSPFMPQDVNPGSVQLIRRDVQTGACTDMSSGQPVPCPPGSPAVPKASPTPKTPAAAANTAVPQPSPEAGSTPKPMATPPPKAPRSTPAPADKNKTTPPKPAPAKPEKNSEPLPGL